MLARIAYELFWLGRSVARADHTARLLEGVFHDQLEQRQGDPSTTTLSWNALLSMTGTATSPGAATQDKVIALLVTDTTHPASIVASIDAARERARAVRDVISLDMWESINTLRMRICIDDLEPELRREPSAVFDRVRVGCSLFWGVQRRTMLRDESWSFLQAGAELEAADIVARMLWVSLPMADESQESDATRDGPALALLRAVGGFQAFRRAGSSPPHLIPVARFLMFHAAFPDSLAASIEGLRRALTRSDASPAEAPPILRLARLVAELDFRRRANASVRELIDTLQIVQRELELVNDDIADRYFAGAQRPSLNSPVSTA